MNPWIFAGLGDAGVAAMLNVIFWMRRKHKTGKKKVRICLFYIIL